jgi:hypothetical protein
MKKRMRKQGKRKEILKLLGKVNKRVKCVQKEENKSKTTSRSGLNVCFFREGGRDLLFSKRGR